MAVVCFTPQLSPNSAGLKSEGVKLWLRLLLVHERCLFIYCAPPVLLFVRMLRVSG